MIKAPCLIRVSFATATVCLVILVPSAQAKGRPAMSHSGGHAPKMHAPSHPSYHAPKMPHNAPHVASKAPKVSHAMTPNVIQPQNVARAHTANTAATGTSGRRASSAQSQYYGSNRSYGRGRMPYRRYGSSYGRRSYGSNPYARAILSRLRSAHAALARADHDYQGHRVQAMHAVRAAIRQIGHSSSRRYGMSATGAGMFQGVANRNNLRGARRNQVRRLSQAQSDALMRRAGQTLQLVGTHMASQGGTSRMARAYGYVNRALQHVSIALSVR
ncbi:MAG: hypothetical protein P4L84_30965 [Isosphaeraceae bacterium]|nr:hypothetical protein [Isosphaeraceae bacterium]